MQQAKVSRNLREKDQNSDLQPNIINITWVQNIKMCAFSQVLAASQPSSQEWVIQLLLIWVFHIYLHSLSNSFYCQTQYSEVSNKGNWMLLDSLLWEG